METHNKESIKNFLLSEILGGNQEPSSTEKAKELVYLSKERVSRPLIYVGMGTCGVIAGAAKTFHVIEEYLEDHGIEADLVQGGCMGLCTAEPIVDVQLPGRARLSFSNITQDLVHQLLDDVLNQRLPELKTIGQYTNEINQPWDNIPSVSDHSFFKNQQRVVLEHNGKIDPYSIEEYIALGGYKTFCKTISTKTPQEVCDIIDDSMLLGRGGGGFSVGRKWKVTLGAPSDQKYLVCNAVDSDPGSYMNRVIIEGNPHRLIEGLLLSAYAIGASKAYIFVRQEFEIAIHRLQKAIDSAYHYGLAGHNIFDSGININLILRPAARAYISGEETALVKSLEGKRAMPESKPPFPSEKGLWSKPTCVNNTETLFNIPLILKNGAQWFEQLGTETSKGTKIFTLSGKLRNCGTVEVAMGTTFREIVWKMGNGIPANQKFKAILLGINSNSYITEETLDTRVDFADLKNIGTVLGSGGFVVVDQNTCMVDLAKYYTRFFERESCGKCIPCRDGTTQLLQIMEASTKRPDGAASIQTLERFKGIIQLGRLANVMKDTSLCGLGKSAPNSIQNMLKNFRAEFDAHVFERKCPAGVCNDLRVFYIDVEKCIGCNACQKKCPMDAIIGSPRQPHFIVEEKCHGCGSCYDSCKFNAIEIL